MKSPTPLTKVILTFLFLFSFYDGYSQGHSTLSGNTGKVLGNNPSCSIIQIRWTDFLEKRLLIES
jgi:hypothetical protein